MARKITDIPGAARSYKNFVDSVELFAALQVLLTASNANVGGPATAAAMAAARGWSSMIRPAMLTGSLGYAVGTAIGIAMASLLQS